MSLRVVRPVRICCYSAHGRDRAVTRQTRRRSCPSAPERAALCANRNWHSRCSGQVVYHPGEMAHGRRPEQEGPRHPRLPPSPLAPSWTSRQIPSDDPDALCPQARKRRRISQTPPWAPANASTSPPSRAGRGILQDTPRPGRWAVISPAWRHGRPAGGHARRASRRPRAGVPAESRRAPPNCAATRRERGGRPTPTEKARGAPGAWRRHLGTSCFRPCREELLVQRRRPVEVEQHGLERWASKRSMANEGPVSAAEVGHRQQHAGRPRQRFPAWSERHHEVAAGHYDLRAPQTATCMGHVTTIRDILDQQPAGCAGSSASTRFSGDHFAPSRR